MTSIDSTFSLRINPLQQMSCDQFNHLYGSESDISRYDNLRMGKKATGPLIDLLNQLQIAELIPDRIAILIKNNLHDFPFLKAALGNWLLDLKNQHSIGEQCFLQLHAQINRNQIEQVLNAVYASLLYAKLAEAHDRNVIDPIFCFQNPEAYSNRLLRLNPFQLQVEVKKLEAQFQRKSLATLLFKLGSSAHLNSLLVEKKFNLIAEFNQSPLSPLFEIKEELISFLEQLVPLTSQIEGLCIQNLLNEAQKTEPEQLIPKIYTMLAAEEHLKRCIRSVEALNQSLQFVCNGELLSSIAKCKSAYNGSVYLLRDCAHFSPLFSLRYHQLAGEMKNKWQKINTVMAKATEQFTHDFCSCQAAPPGILNGQAEWPFQSNSIIEFDRQEINGMNTPSTSQISPLEWKKNHQKTIAVIGCDWGGGHREASRGIAKYLSQIGYHTHTIDLPKVLISEDPVRNHSLTRFLSQDWTVASLFNGLLKEKAYACVNFLRSLSKGAPDPEQHQRKLILTLNQLMTSNPEMVITTYSADNEVIFDACELLGIPCLHYATDIDTSIETRTAPRESKHIKMAIAFNEREMVSRIEATTRPDQRIIGGPLVRSEFNIPRTEQDALRFKQEKGIDSNKKIVIIANGKNGASSKHPEMLAKRYAHANPEEIPIHLVVLCGANNQKAAREMERNIRPFTNMPMSIYTHIPGEEMEKFMTMAAYGGCIIGKAGGGTLFEAAARGTRLLVDKTTSHFLAHGALHFFVSILEWVLQAVGYKGQLPWEEINMEFAEKHGLASAFYTEEEFLDKLDETLANHAPAQLPFEIRNCQSVLKETVISMTEAAERDINMMRARQKLISI